MLKKTFYIVFAFAVFCSAFSFAQANTETSSAWDAVILDSSIQFTASLEADGSVAASWSKYSHPETFTYYKVIRSQTNSNPVYPDDGYIYYDGNIDALTYTDQEVPAGISYYRVCQIASPKRYCSKTVVTVNKNGTSGSVISNETGSTVEAVSASVSSLPENPSAIFADVAADHWALSCIEKLKNKGVVSGNAAGYFEPEKPVNRAEYAKLVMKAYYPDIDQTVKTNACFGDVSGSSWYAPYVCAAQGKGIILGYANNTYRPDNSITRAEGVSIIVKTLGLTLNDTSSSPFRDVTIAWQVKLIGTAVANKLVNGYTATTFGPNDRLSKAQAAQMICNALDVQTEPHPENNPPVVVQVDPPVVPVDIGTLSNRTEALIIGHNNTDLTKIPVDYIDAARNQFRIAYGHTSHGSQLTSGMSLLPETISAIYKYNADGSNQSLYYNENLLSGDLGGDWDTQTRTLLAKTDNTINLVMWSWCGQVSGMSTADVSSYLSKMDKLEQDFPNVVFVYFTGHLDGTGEAGTLNKNNEQIRKFVRDKKKVLFDFADIESYDPSGMAFLSSGATDGNAYDNGTKNWADQWCNSNPNSPLCASVSCAHSTSLNCNLKGRAIWWLFARLAGWNGI